MTIIFYDGGTMKCNEINFYENGVIVDGFDRFPIIAILRIISD